MDLRGACERFHMLHLGRSQKKKTKLQRPPQGIDNTLSTKQGHETMGTARPNLESLSRMGSSSCFFPVCQTVSLLRPCSLVVYPA
ncbi:hypothetical protein CaCOL14_011518 [Colletotrichum acutatum]